jgi:hypothetical protein
MALVEVIRTSGPCTMTTVVDEDQLGQVLEDPHVFDWEVQVRPVEPEDD